MKIEQPESDKYKSLSDKSLIILNVIKSLQTNKIIKDCCNDSFPVYIENTNVKFETNPYMFCFNNVVYDLQKDGVLDVPNRDDFMTLNTGYDYRVPTDNEIEKLNELFEKVFPIADERKLYLTLLSTGLFGTTLEKFILANGGGRNGKGFTNELALAMYGNYGYTCSNSVLLSAIKDGANQSIANMNNRRFIVYREPDTDTYSRLNTSTVKELTGGSEINARGLYESNTKTNLKGTHILECNQKPKMSGETDDAIIMRIIDIGFRSTFTNKHEEINDEICVFKGDDNVKSINFKENHNHALFHILLDHWKEYKIKNLNKDQFNPIFITQRSDKYLQSSDEIYSWFVETYEKVEDKNDVIQLKDIYENFKLSECYLNYKKKEKRECNQSMFFEKIEKNPYLRKHYKERLKDKLIQDKYKVKEMRTVLLGFKKTIVEIKVADKLKDLEAFEMELVEESED